MSEVRLIDANALKLHTVEVLTQDDVDRIIDATHTIDPVRHAHWITTNVITTHDTSDGGYKIIHRMRRMCSGCGRRSAVREPYCPKCGAKMDEVAP